MSPRPWQVFAGVAIAALAVAAFIAPARQSQPFSVICPSAGLFTGADDLHGLPNPARGWQVFIDGYAGLIALKKVDASDSWVVSCLIRVPPRGNVEAQFTLPGRLACILSPTSAAAASECAGSRGRASVCEIRCAPK